MHFISFPISVFLLDCISFFCTSVFLLHCISLYFFAAQYSWRRGSKSLVQLLMLDKWSSPLGPLRTYTLIYFWSPPFISWNNSLKFSIYSNGKMMSLSVRPTDDLYSHLWFAESDRNYDIMIYESSPQYSCQHIDNKIHTGWFLYWPPPP